MQKTENLCEAILLLENALVSARKLAKAAAVSEKEVDRYIDTLNDKYKKSGSVFTVVKLENAYKLTIRDDFYHPALEKYAGKKKKISGALLETLAIIAYKQPATNGEVSDIRGVNSANYIKILLDDQFIKIAGKKDVPGKPFMYKTTAKFLTHFGLKNLKELPTLKEIKSFDFLDNDQENKS
ncbi:MAG TPA: SMC-Scp complex subunit ScpB [Spirochaetota bacterium]|nr:SMC-Scp complex subunit ScpB [Spirochaetota bacterium]